MPLETYIFQRIEKKYMLTEDDAERLFKKIGASLEHDAYANSTVGSLYLDTPDFRLIRNSIDAKEYEMKYKEKLRLRGYGEVNEDSRVFLEIKKKFKGVVYKRRVAMPIENALLYLKDGTRAIDSQIMREIDYTMKVYEHPKPTCAIFYEREAYVDKEIPSLRLTFDRNVRYRTDALDLRLGSFGKVILPENAVLLEIKTDGGMPLPLSKALDELSIYPTSFSKYGTAYTDLMKTKNTIIKGEFIYA